MIVLVVVVVVVVGDRNCHGILGLANNLLPVVVNGDRLSCVSRLPVP